MIAGWPVLALVVALLTGVFAPLPQAQAVAAQSQSFHMDPYNAEITINRDGSVDVIETLTYVYDSGTFYRATRHMPLGRVESITGVSVAEQVNGQWVDYRQAPYDYATSGASSTAQPGTFGTMTEGGELWVRWIYQPTTDGQSRTFTLRYHAAGAIRVYPDHYELQWKAIPTDWDSPIYESEVTVHVPPGVDVSQLDIASSPPVAAVREGSTITWRATDVDNGLEVGVKLPPGALQASQPSWQAGVDARERAQPLIDIGLLLVSLLIVAGGTLWGVRRWYLYGRDKPVKLLTDYLTEPPSDLPPGLVGTLLDESADVRDVVATVVDQAAKGNLLIEQTERGGLFSSNDFQYTLLNNQVRYRFEDMVLAAIFKHGNPVKLSDLKNTFYKDLPPIYEEMYRTLVGLKYFPENPEAVRNRNRGLGGFMALLGGVVIFCTFTVFSDFSPLLILPGIALVITGIIWLVIGGIMPRKTDLGAEQAEKWRAFGRYLEQIQRYTDVQAAADRFQKYLPYAVALGVERQLIHQFNSVPAAMPTWYRPYGWYPYPYGQYPVGMAVGERSAGAGDSPAPAADMPSFNPAEAMQSASQSLAAGMQSMSDSFTAMVNSAASVLTSQPSSSGGGGGWGGGGGSFGGGGGGGGGGGAD
jgi:uncharacterized membrane protein YgcG